MAGYIGANTSSVTNNQNAAERRKKFTFTANTTVLSGLNFAPQKIHIFHNGIRLVRTTDYVEASDGKSVTLVNAAQAGDEVVAVTFAQDPASNAGYTDADVDAHLLTAGVTLDATNDRVGFGTASPQQLIDASAASADARIRVHSSTNSTPSAGIELMRGTNTTFGADAYTDFRIENINGGHLTFNTGESGTITEQFRVNSDGHVTKPNQPFCSVAYTGGNITSAQAIDFNVVTENNGNHYNSSNGRFTAPIAGHYMVNVSVLSGNGATAGFSMMKNSTNLRKAEFTRSGTSYAQFGANMIINLGANDYVEVQWKNGSIYGGGGNYTMMDVYLLG